jgi:uncharacterized membrane protein YccF (DUF307 family)
MTQAVAVKPVKQTAHQLPFLLRVIWFFVLGWELAGIWILIAWVFNATLIGLPVGLWMIDRVPQVLTLKSRSGSWVVDLKSGRGHYKPTGQLSWLIRLPYFILVGWWLSLLWATLRLVNLRHDYRPSSWSPYASRATGGHDPPKRLIDEPYQAVFLPLHSD